MRPLFLKELRLAVVASWRDISCWRLHSAATTGVNAVCITFLEPLVSHSSRFEAVSPVYIATLRRLPRAENAKGRFW